MEGRPRRRKGQGCVARATLSLTWAVHSVNAPTGKEKNLEDLQDEESEEEFDSDEELQEEEEEGWGAREFVSDESDLEEPEENAEAWDLEEMGLEKVGEEADDVSAFCPALFVVVAEDYAPGWRVDFGRGGGRKRSQSCRRP